MYVNKRDQINYHGFLKSARAKSGASQSEVAKGLYTSSSYNRAELGVRVAEKLMRDRLTSRMGFSGEKYVEYLGFEEYQQWQFRQELVKAVAEKDAETAEAVYSELEKVIDKTNTVQVQFMKSMRFFIQQLKGASCEELFASVKEAVDCTVENIDKALIGRHLLAEQELNLIAEYMRLLSYAGKPSNENTWRILEYQKLITYMNHSFMENLTKVKVYPKVTCFICELLLKEEAVLYKLREALQLCDKSLDMLFDTHRLYYLIEILEYRKEVLSRMSAFDLDETERSQVQIRLAETMELETFWKAHYAESGVSYYMTDSTYLYWETECHSAVEVIEARRKMLRIPRTTLCEGICTERSLIRIERTNGNPSMFVLNNLFERMGLCAEYRRGQLVSSNTDLLDIYRKLVKAMNTFCKEDCEAYLEELKKGLCMKLSFNKQEVKRVENLCAEKEGTLTEAQLEDALECTLPVWALYNHKNNANTYFTRSELACIYDLAFMVNGPNSEQCIEIIKGYCENHLQKGIHPSNLGGIEFLLNGLTSYLTAVGKKEEAGRLRKELLKACFTYKRMPFSLANDKQKQLMWIE